MSFFYQNRQEQLYLYLSKNNPYAVHLHRQLELIYVLSGSTIVTVEQQDFLLTPGQGVLVFPNQMHGLKHVEPGQNLLCIFEPDFCHSFRQFFQNKKPARNDFTVSSLSEHSRIALQGLKTLAAAWKRIVPHLPMYKSMRKGISHSCWQTCCHRCLCKCVKTQMTGIGAKTASLSGCPYTEELSLESLSKEFGVSRFVLSRIFTEKLHTTFPDYVNSRRLDYARDFYCPRSSP